jgi:copper homeostasis protein
MIKEACVETLEEALKAEKLGAGRVELCSNLELDGLTPRPEIVRKACLALRIPVMVMIRPRPGNFVYSDKEIQEMRAEIDMAREAGAAGVVFGLLTPENRVDEINTKILAGYAAPLSVTFHKAIDEVANLLDAVKTLQRIQTVSNILTSGGKATAIEGAGQIRKMVEVSKGFPEIISAGKVTSENLDEVRKLTGAKALHGRRIVGALDD